MKKALSLFALCSVVLAGAFAFGQQTPVATPVPAASFDMGVFYAPNFGLWQAKLAAPISTTGSVAFTVDRGVVTTPDGLTFVPFANKEKIIIGAGASAETVTISAVSGCNASALVGLPATCTVTASSVANAHSAGEPVVSADSGTIEAINYVSNTGGGEVYFLVDCGPITLSTGGVTTTSTCFVPNEFYNQGSASRVTTTITTSTSWAVGIVNNTSTFSTAQSTLTAGTTSYGTQGTPAMALVTGATAPDLTAVLITAGGGAAGAGAVHVKVWGYTAAPPAF